MSTPSENTRWQCSLSLSESLSELRKRDMMTDVTFVVGIAPHVRITAHKLVLSARSPVFCTMFHGPLAESGEIEIPDICGDIFISVLGFMYGEDVSITKENVEQMLYASEKYDLESLKFDCDKYLSENLDESTKVLQSLELSHKFNLQVLRAKSLNVIQNKTKECIGSKEFLQLSKESIKSVLDCDELAIEEIEVFRTALKWAEAECERQSLSSTNENIRNTLGNIIYSIRFPTMDGETFCQNVYDRGILNSDEKCDIMRQLLTKHETYASSFVDKPRLLPTLHEILRFATTVQSGWNGLENSISIAFEVSGNAYLIGVLMFKRYDGYPYTLTVTKGTEVLSSQIEDGQSSTKVLKNNMFELRLPYPIALKSNVKYNVIVSHAGHFLSQGKNGIEKVKFSDRYVSFLSAGRSFCTDVKAGQLPGLLLR